MTIALMYHALYRGNDQSRIAVEDRPYAVSDVAFAAQLDRLNELCVGVLPEGSQASLPDVIITFDDGHLSNVDIALPLLLERGLRAYFFITSDRVDRREHFCTPDALRELVDADMIVGSHGASHRFFDDLDPDEAYRELEQSQSALADWCGTTATSLSFPGGRYRKDTLQAARSLGFTEMFGSSFGTIGVKPANSLRALARIAIRQGTTIDEFERIIGQDSHYYRRQRLLGEAKRLLRRSLGNRLYHGLYKHISA